MADRDDDAKGTGTQVKPDSTGTNSRPRNDTIAGTGPGLPDDSGSPVEVDPEEAKRIEERIRSLGTNRGA